MAKERRSITITKNYKLFHLSKENRELCPQRHKQLKKSMQQYGFLVSFPIVCVRNPEKKLVVKDGQHRLLFARELGLPVPYVIEQDDFDIAIINCTGKTWSPADYAQKFAANGLRDYERGLAFAERFKLPVTKAFTLLAGYTGYGNVMEDFKSGKFKVKDEDWACVVASTYNAMVGIEGRLKTARFLEACMAVCRVGEFDPGRLIKGAHKRRDKLASYSTRDAYLEMIEEVYNFGKRRLFPLKIAALQAMRERNACTK